MQRLSYISLLFALVILSACSKKLDLSPVSNITTENFYTNVNDFQQAVNGAYSKLKAYPDWAMWLGEMRSDNVNPASDGNRDWQGINDFSPNLTTTAFIVGAWNDAFNGIYNTNTVLDAIAAKGTGILSDSLSRRFTAECRFLRSFYYFSLLRLYGKVPILDKVMTTTEVGNIGRSPVAEVYNFIIGDLQFAIDNLPASYPSADIGRPTSYAAKGMLGLVYMTRSGPTYGIDGGPGLNSNEYDKALALFNDIINSGRYAFLNDYASIFSYTNENNKEVLFDVQFVSTSSAADFPSQLVPDTYWTGLGLQSYGNGYGSASYNVTRNMLQSYRNNAGGGVDKRDTFSIQHAFAPSASEPTVMDTSRPFIRKYIDLVRKGTKRDDWPINFIVLRYTDILMMKAECILHGATGSQADVDNIVNQVRSRAGIAPTSNVTLPVLMEERRREFLGEGLRWNDLVREGMAVTTMNASIASDTLSATVHEVMPQFIIYPVPQAEILAKPGLYDQNQGYY